MPKDIIIQFITSEIAPDVHADEIAPDYNLFEGGVLDSLSMVRLIAWIGEKFAVPINDVDIVPTDLHTVQGIIGFIGRHTQSQPVPAEPVFQ